MLIRVSSSCRSGISRYIIQIKQSRLEWYLLCYLLIKFTCRINIHSVLIMEIIQSQIESKIRRREKKRVKLLNILFTFELQYHIWWHQFNFYFYRLTTLLVDNCLAKSSSICILFDIVFLLFASLFVLKRLFSHSYSFSNLSNQNHHRYFGSTDNHHLTNTTACFCCHIAFIQTNYICHQF